MKTKIKILLIACLMFLPLANLTAQTLEGELIKGESFNTVYYKSTDGKRYVFPNQRIYNSWYEDFSKVKTIPDEELFNISLGGNVFYKPNSRLVKITTNPKVYWVDKNGLLRHVASEYVAQSLFGDNWIEQVDDLPDEFFTGYEIGELISAGHNISIETDWTIDKNKEYTHSQPSPEPEPEPTPEPDPEPIVDEGQQPESINLTITMNSQDATLEWFTQGGNTDNGFVVVRSESNNPTYPEDEYRIDVNSSATVYKWNDLPNNKGYYFKVCRRNSDGTCGTYSDVESVTTGVTSYVPNMTLTGNVEDGVVKLFWEKSWMSPDYGFYVVRNINGSPEYKTDPGVWVEKQEESYEWSGLSYGTYYFRVCRYINTTVDDCEYYSNDLELTIE